MSAWMATDRAGCALDDRGAYPRQQPTVLDDEILDELCGDDPTFRHELLGRFETSCSELLARLDEAAHIADAAALGETAHRLKGAALSIGANAFAAALLEVERRGDGGDAAGAARALNSARLAYRNLVPRLLQSVR